KKRADERIKNALNDPNIDIKRAEASLNRALNRLEIASMK
ncbi:MAG: F0F1 ATP synthase subunit epsilon, partial [Firmicutes bacterium]|nr:F0F1 ATP synthase subunit epsilon [Candidatus Scatoplasma merdavium]